MKATEIQQIGEQILSLAIDMKEAEARLKMAKVMIEEREANGMKIDYTERDKHAVDVQNIRSEIKLLSSQLTNQL
jgi:hypothetical protein